MSTSATAKGICFTLHDYTDNDCERIKNLKTTYLVFGYETCPDTGRPHLQGYMEFKTSKRFKTLKKLFPTMHLESRKGTRLEASDYCKKVGKYYEDGEIKSQGKRNDLKNVCEAVKNGAKLFEIAEEFPETFVKFTKGITALRSMKLTPRTDKPYIEWRWGLAGTGKTRYCVEKHSNHYIKDGTQWWDNYDGQEAIIIDDFEAKSWPYRDFLRLIDRYAYQGQFKGGYVNINSPYIYITCEHPPQFYWTDNKLAQVVRRIDKIVEVIPTRIPENTTESPAPPPVAEVAGNTRPQPDFLLPRVVKVNKKKMLEMLKE